MGLDGIEIIMSVERLFDIKISDDEAEHCLSVGALIEVVWNRVDRTRWTEIQVKNRIRRIVADQLGHRIKDVRPESNFVDLGIT